MSIWTSGKIKDTFKGRLVGSDRVKDLVIKTLLIFPDEIIEKISKTCWVLSSHPEAWAYTFTGNDLKDKQLIFLSDELFNEPLSQIQFTIAHEIGHIILNHKNSIDYKQSSQEIEHQENEADAFANQYLSLHSST